MTWVTRKVGGLGLGRLRLKSKLRILSWGIGHMGFIGPMG